ncbi:MAG: right-handed parallel beta-helix repeat-containing protein [Candidatus Omnitrophota bacterium]
MQNRRNMEKCWLLPVLFGMMVILPAAAMGYTESGQINGAETWSGTIELLGDIVITKTGALTIQPGTVIKCEPKFDMEVGGEDTSRIEIVADGGKLFAEGTKEKPIRFTTYNDVPKSDDWYGIVVKSDQVSLKYCTIEYGRYGVYIGQNGLPTVENCVIQENWINGILMKTNNKFTFSSCTISKNGVKSDYYCDGIRVDVSTTDANSSLTLNGCVIKENKYRGVHSGNFKTIVSNSNISLNSNIGIENSGQSLAISNSTINDNKSHGVWGYYANMTITDSEINRNSQYGIYGKVIKIANCKILQNKSYGMQVWSSALATEGTLIQDCSINENTYPGIFLSSGSGSTGTFIIKNCEINKNGNSVTNSYGSGIYGDDSTVLNVLNCTVKENKSAGISFAKLGVQGITGNIIEGNQYGVEFRSNETKFTMSPGNDIFNNIEYELKNAGKAAVVVNGNYVGELNTQELDNGVRNLTKVFDSRDDANVGAIIIQEYAKTKIVEGAGELPTPTITPTATKTPPPSTPIPTPIPTKTPIPPVATSTPTNTLIPVMPTPTPATTTPVPGNAIGGGTFYIAPGDEVTVALNVTGMASTKSLGMELKFDPAVLSYVKISKENTLLSKWSMLDAALLGTDVLNLQGLGDAVSGSGTLAYLTFKANASAAAGSSSSIVLSNLVGLTGLTPAPIAIVIGVRGDLNQDNVMNILDVQILFEHVLKKTVTDSEKSACDFNKDGTVNILDVSIMFESVLKKQPLPAKSARRSVQPSAAVGLTVSTVDGTPGGTVEIAVTASGGVNVTSLEMEIVYDASKLEYKAFDKTGTVLTGFSMFDAYDLGGGKISIAGIGSSSAANGKLFTLQFTAKSGATGSAAVSITPSSVVGELSGATIVNGGANFGGTSATPTPTATPATTAPTATPTALSGGKNTVEVFDNVGDSSGDLTGKTDFDSSSARTLVIHCNAAQTNATDWHVYVRKGLGGFKYLGRTASGTDADLEWYSGATNIDPDFAKGPDFNSVYSFRMVRLDGKLGADDIFSTANSIGFNSEGGNEVSLSLPDVPNLKSGEVVIYDDILGGNNLAPMDGIGQDADRSTWRALQIAWNFGVDDSTVNEYQVYISVDGSAFEFFGQTCSGSTNYYWWTSKKDFKIAAKYAGGPENGHTYQFKIWMLPFTGTNQSMTSGKIIYTAE